MCDGRCGSQYAYATLPRSKLASYTVCVEPRATFSVVFSLCAFLTWTVKCYPRGDIKIKHSLFY